MFRNTHQHGFLSILFSVGSNPLAIWGSSIQNGHMKRVTDDDVHSLVIELEGNNVVTAFIYCPKDPKAVLGIKLPFLILIIKNLKKYFSFEITILDDKYQRRRFRVSNFQSCTKVRPFCCTMPLCLNEGWNQGQMQSRLRMELSHGCYGIVFCNAIFHKRSKLLDNVQFNLADFTRRAYGTNFLEAVRLQIHANCRIRRIYFADRLYSEDELPADFKLYMPVVGGGGPGRR